MRNWDQQAAGLEARRRHHLKSARRESHFRNGNVKVEGLI